MDLTKLGPKGSEIRGNEFAMIFREPMASLNPAFTIANQIMEAFVLHQSLSKKDAQDKGRGILQSVGISSPGESFHYES